MISRVIGKTHFDKTIRQKLPSYLNPDSDIEEINAYN